MSSAPTTPQLTAIDLNLLVVLRALLAERNVTRAAAKIGLSQSATSHALARLRELYRDPLLVRSGKNLEPTTRAVGLLPALDRALTELHATVAGPEPFDPKTARRAFSFGTADYGQSVLFGPLLSRLAVEAPGVDLEISAAPDLHDLLDSGELELAAVVQRETRSRHRSLKLFDDTFTCMVRRDHPPF